MRWRAGAWLVAGCSLVACQAISGLSGFGLGADGATASGGPAASGAQVSGNGGASQTIGTGPTQGGAPNGTSTGSPTASNGSGGVPNSGPGPGPASSTTVVTTAIASSSSSSSSSASSTASIAASGAGGGPVCAHWIFVDTNAGYNGAAITNADLGCQTAGKQVQMQAMIPAPPIADWKAVYATAAQSVLMRITLKGDVCNVDNSPVADLAHFIGPMTMHKNPILNGFAMPPPKVSVVWTGADAMGMFVPSCGNWTVNTGNGHVGQPSTQDLNWLSTGDGPCQMTHSVYCISQH